MFSKAIAWFKGEVTSIETILSNWLRAVEQLEHHAEQQTIEAAKHAEDAVQLQKRVEEVKAAEADALVAAEKAKVIAAQLKTIVNADVATVQAQAAQVEATVVTQ